MSWPFMRRSTHERECLRLLREQADNSARNAAAGAARAVAWAAGRAQIALVRAEAAEAQLRNLSGPLIDVTRRMSALTVAARAPAPGDATTKVVVCLTFQDQAINAFAGHARALGHAVRELVYGAMQVLHANEGQGAKAAPEEETR